MTECLWMAFLDREAWRRGGVEKALSALMRDD